LQAGSRSRRDTARCGCELPPLSPWTQLETPAAQGTGVVAHSLLASRLAYRGGRRVAPDSLPLLVKPGSSSSLDESASAWSSRSGPGRSSKQLAVERQGGGRGYSA